MNQKAQPELSKREIYILSSLIQEKFVIQESISFFPQTCIIATFWNQFLFVNDFNKVNEKIQSPTIF